MAKPDEDFIDFRLMKELRRMGSAPFVYLREAFSLTDGALATHLRKLERLGLINSEKFKTDRYPITFYHLTEDGIQKFKELIEDG